MKLHPKVATDIPEDKALVLTRPLQKLSNRRTVLLKVCPDWQSCVMCIRCCTFNDHPTQTLAVVITFMKSVPAGSCKCNVGISW